MSYLDISGCIFEPHVIGMTFQDNKVIRVIVELITVNMMDRFSKKKWSTNFLFSNNTMNCLSANFEVVF